MTIEERGYNLAEKVSIMITCVGSEVGAGTIGEQGGAKTEGEGVAVEQLYITLFGKLSVRYNGQTLAGSSACKVQELLSFLLLHRDQPFAREKLASMLWGDHYTTSQSKAYLRKALWQLQSVLKGVPEAMSQRLLCADQEWIQLNAIDELWLDVAVVEEAYQSVRGVPGRDLCEERARTLEASVLHYRGDLLENWYHDWCLCERERLLQIHLILLNKLMEYCEAQGAYEKGLFYGEHILQHDHAQERAHRNLMRLHYRAGNRTAALRQYERCVAALQEDFDARPADSTIRLYEHIRLDKPVANTKRVDPSATTSSLPYLRQVEADLSETLRHVRLAIAAAEGQHPEGSSAISHSSSRT